MTKTAFLWISSAFNLFKFIFYVVNQNTLSSLFISSLFEIWNKKKLHFQIHLHPKLINPLALNLAFKVWNKRLLSTPSTYNVFHARINKLIVKIT